MKYSARWSGVFLMAHVVFATAYSCRQLSLSQSSHRDHYFEPFGTSQDLMLMRESLLARQAEK
jgi:hypothetical protein